MAFWNTTELDPKRQFKFRVTFDFLNRGTTDTSSTFIAQTADRPSYTISDTAKIHYLDKEFSFPGKITWKPIKVKFVDATGVGSVNVSSQTYQYLARAGWISPNGAAGGIAPENMGTINKKAGVLNIGIDVLDSSGTTVDRWTIKNAFINDVALNNLDYAAEAILTVEYTFRYDWAELTGRTIS